MHSLKQVKGGKARQLLALRPHSGTYEDKKQQQKDLQAFQRLGFYQILSLDL